MNGWAGTPRAFMMQTTSFAHLEAPPAPNNNCRQSSWRTSRWSSRSKGSTSTWHGFASWTWKTSNVACFNVSRNSEQGLDVSSWFWKETTFWKQFQPNFFLVFNFHFFFVCQCVDPMIFLQRARAWALLVFVIILLLRVWLRFFSKKSHDIPSCYKVSFFLTFCKFPKSKKTKKISNK